MDSAPPINRATTEASTLRANMCLNMGLTAYVKPKMPFNQMPTAGYRSISQSKVGGGHLFDYSFPAPPSTSTPRLRVYTSFRKFDQPFPRSPDQREGRLFAKTLAMEELETQKIHFIGPSLKEGGYGSTLQANICLNMRLTHM